MTRYKKNNIRCKSNKQHAAKQLIVGLQQLTQQPIANIMDQPIPEINVPILKPMKASQTVSKPASKSAF